MSDFNESQKKISVLTRRDISDALMMNNLSWSGRLEESAFLARIYDLKQMPSGDSRYPDAAGDIFQHRTNNHDWDDDWVFMDYRFDLLNGSDENFLKFLCETLHPLVRRGLSDTDDLLNLYNKSLEKDGFILVETDQISGRSIYSAKQLADASLPSIAMMKAAMSTFDTSYLNQQIVRIELAIQDDPELAIGTAKELVETTCRTILKDRGFEEVKRLELPQLIKEVTSILQMTPSHIGDEVRAAETIKRLLGNLSSIVHNMAELRNEYGTGHGKITKAKGLTKRHAKLAVGAASTLAVFLFESHQEELQRNKQQAED